MRLTIICPQYNGGGPNLEIMKRRRIILKGSDCVISEHHVPHGDAQEGHALSPHLLA